MGAMDTAVREISIGLACMELRGHARWGRRIPQGYEVDHLVCPRGAGAMRSIAVIEQPEESELMV